MSTPMNCVIKDCPGVAAYRVGPRGFCFKHKQEAIDWRQTALGYLTSKGIDINQNKTGRGPKWVRMLKRKEKA